MEWGDLHFVYSWNRTYPTSSAPDYVCYNEQICGSFSSLSPTIHIAKISEPSTILLCQSTSVFLPVPSQYEWEYQFTRVRTAFFSQCSTSTNGRSEDCPENTQFRCGNRCISKHRLVDGKYDCMDRSDDNFNNSCSLNDKHRIQCTATKPGLFYRKGPFCILLVFARRRTIQLLCKENQNRIHFPTICNGYVEYDQIINGQNETDETNCEQWQCDNQYTRCDAIWNCRNGADEARCSHPICKNIEGHPCLSPITTEYICLPLARAGDGKIDCLGATDERHICRSLHGSIGYHCWNNHTNNEQITDG